MCYSAPEEMFAEGERSYIFAPRHGSLLVSDTVTVKVLPQAM